MMTNNMKMMNDMELELVSGGSADRSGYELVKDAVFGEQGFFGMFRVPGVNIMRIPGVNIMR